jgi:hypothetical protein
MTVAHGRAFAYCYDALSHQGKGGKFVKICQNHWGYFDKSWVFMGNHE